MTPPAKAGKESVMYFIGCYQPECGNGGPTFDAPRKAVQWGRDNGYQSLNRQWFCPQHHREEVDMPSWLAMPAIRAARQAMKRLPLLILCACLAVAPGCQFVGPALAAIDIASKVIRVVVPDKEKPMATICSCGQPLSRCPVGHGWWCTRCNGLIACPQCEGARAYPVAPDRADEPEEDETDED